MKPRPRSSAGTFSPSPPVLPAGKAPGRSPSPVRRFASADELLEAARAMFKARSEALTTADSSPAPQRRRSRREKDPVPEDDARSRAWHASFKRSGDAIALCAAARRHGLSPVECEILAALVLDRLALSETDMRTAGDVVHLVSPSGDQAVTVMRCLSERGRLFAAGLIAYDDEENDLRERTIVVDPLLVEAVLEHGPDAADGWPARTEPELYSHLGVLTRALQKKAASLTDIRNGGAAPSTFYRLSRKVAGLLHRLDATLATHPDWGASRLFDGARARWRAGEKLILAALAGKALGHVGADDSLFSGGGLALAASGSPAEMNARMAALRMDGDLITEGFIQPCGAEVCLASDDPQILEELEFELTDKSLEILGIEKHSQARRRGNARSRKPKTSLDHLVLADEVKQALRMALTQALHRSTLMDAWGLGRIFPYGRATTLLFSGPPGVGKTACAEAMAHELGRPILVADYAQIQNCFVGATEKNIVGAFREATATGAVLFWDEADAMFFDRDSARNNWEVRDVNVLLVELERFDGICILATNRVVSLDKALERRISLKVEFARPDRDARRKIWQRMLPEGLPLSRFIDMDRLSEAELTGGEIKNVILNAARLALARNGRGPLMMHDFLRASAMETKTRWTPESQRCIGFR